MAMHLVVNTFVMMAAASCFAQGITSYSSLQLDTFEKVTASVFILCLFVIVPNDVAKVLPCDPMTTLPRGGIEFVVRRHITRYVGRGADGSACVLAVSSQRKLALFRLPRADLLF